MDPLSILCVLVGALIIAGRGPVIFAPAATLRFANTLLSTDAHIRGIAVVLTPLAVALIALPLGEGEVAGILRFFGWVSGSSCSFCKPNMNYSTPPDHVPLARSEVYVADRKEG